MPNLSSYSFPQMTDLIKRSFKERQKSINNVMRNSSIVVVDNIEKGNGLFKRYAEYIDVNEYSNQRDEGDTSKQAKTQYGYEKDMTIKTESLEISITKQMRDYGKNQEILRKITKLTDTVSRAIDLDLAHRLTFGDATSYTDRSGVTVDISVGDGLALFSASHTLTGSATTYSNIITGNPQFSKGALENAEKSFVEETYNNLGEKMVCDPDTIITTDDPNTINQVRELLNATADVDTSNSGTFNSYRSKYKHLVSGRIATTSVGAVDTTKRKYWGVADSKMSDFHLGIGNEPYVKTPTNGNNGEEFSSENWNYLTAGDYGICVVSGRWIRWSKGDGS